MLCKYWNEPQITTKIVFDGLYSRTINIYIFLCIDYSQVFFLSLTWPNEANNLISKGRIICNIFNAKWRLYKIKFLKNSILWQHEDSVEKMCQIVIISHSSAQHDKLNICIVCYIINHQSSWISKFILYQLNS